MTTVSYVLNKPDRVSSVTLDRVHASMTELGFVRNDLARQLRSGAASTLGMVVLNVENPFFAQLAHACESAAEEAGYTLVLGSSDQLQAREKRYLEVFEAQRVRGVLIAPLGYVTPEIVALRSRGTPVVMFDVGDSGAGLPAVTMDGRLGGYLATRHLIDTGRRHIAFLGGPLRQVEDRWQGAMQACAEVSGVRLSRIETDDTALVDGRDAGPRIESMPATERPDAVFAANDLVALGLMQALMTSRDISIPRDLAIIGYDDIPYAESAAIPLSTVRQPVDQLAREALRLVLRDPMPATLGDDEVIRLAPELVVRGSTPHV